MLLSELGGLDTVRRCHGTAGPRSIPEEVCNKNRSPDQARTSPHLRNHIGELRGTRHKAGLVRVCSGSEQRAHDLRLE